jgi:hypothetical protein
MPAASQPVSVANVAVMVQRLKFTAPGSASRVVKLPGWTRLIYSFLTFAVILS